MRRATAAIKKENYRYAVYQLKDALRLDRQNPDIWNMLGFSYRMQGAEKFDLAWDAYERALTLDPDHIDANEYLGELYRVLRYHKICCDRAWKRKSVRQR